MTLGELVSIDYDWGKLHLYPPTRYEMEPGCLMELSAAPADMDIEPDDIDVSDSVTFVWEIQSVLQAVLYHIGPFRSAGQAGAGNRRSPGRHCAGDVGLHLHQ